MSPYDNSYSINVQGEVLLSPYDQSDLSNQASNNILDTHIVKEGETLQSIANKYYGDSGAWYRILVFNGFIDPFEITPDTKLFIPK